MRLGIDALISLSRPIGKFSVEGENNIAEFERTTPFIVAVSHSSEFDIPLTIKALGKQLDIAVTDQSSHHNAAEELGMYLSLRLVGKDNFIPISYDIVDGLKRPGAFNPNNALPMLNALDSGKSVLIAAHNPLILQQDNTVKPPKPGYFAAYLSLLSNIPILPVGVDLVPTTKFGKYDARVIIGKPFDLEPIDNIDCVAMLIEKRNEGHSLNDDEKSLLYTSLSALRSSGNVVFSKVLNLQNPTFQYSLIEKQRKIGKSTLQAGHSFIGNLC